MSKILHTVKGEEATDGDNVRLKRIFGHPHTKLFDPFLMLDHFATSDTGFPWHPHRGIETITYSLEGKGKHEDSLGNTGVLNSGDVQWMVAGSGIMHQEMPKPGYKSNGLQFWLNIPASDKMCEPYYEYIYKDEMKVYVGENFKAKVLAGAYKGIEGPIVKDKLKVSMIHFDINKGATVSFERDDLKNGFIYILNGSGKLNEENVEHTTAYVLDSGNFSFEASEDTNLIFCEGIRLNEEVHWSGPIVMNTRSDLIKAFEELQSGTFIKHK